MGIREGWEVVGEGVLLNLWQQTSWADRGRLFPLAEPTRHLHQHQLSFSFFATGIHICASPKLGKILSLSQIRITGKKFAFNKMFFFSPRLFPLLWCKGWRGGWGVGGECLLSRQPFHTMNPSPHGKYKKRNRIMHVFLKLSFMITLNFVY